MRSKCLSFNFPFEPIRHARREHYVVPYIVSERATHLFRWAARARGVAHRACCCDRSIRIRLEWKAKGDPLRLVAWRHRPYFDITIYTYKRNIITFNHIYFITYTLYISRLYSTNIHTHTHIVRLADAARARTIVVRALCVFMNEIMVCAVCASQNHILNTMDIAAFNRLVFFVYVFVVIENKILYVHLICTYI